MSRFTRLHNPAPREVGHSPDEFLQNLHGPASIWLAGEDSSRTRALVTLMHGNEPSGIFALHRWLREGRKPVVNMLILIPSVKAALTSPIYSCRVLPGYRDLNRCFRPPYVGREGELAREILDALLAANPEAVIDMHNTSGSGPGFGVTAKVDTGHQALAALFTERLVVTDLHLGALIETDECSAPIVTIECGGRLDMAAQEFAWQGLCRYFTYGDVLTVREGDWNLELLNKPVRLELAPDCRLSYADSLQAGSDLTLKVDIERHNFGVVNSQTLLGWVGAKGLGAFVEPRDGCYRLEALLRVDRGCLYPARPLKLFMITANKDIAKMDCLGYAVVDNIG